MASESDSAKLARIDERTRLILEQLEDGKNRMTAIEKKQSERPCQTQIEKIKTLEWMTRGSLVLGIGLLVKDFYDKLTGGGGIVGGP